MEEKRVDSEKKVNLEKKMNSGKSVLWVMNIAIPAMAKKLGLEINNKEGWLSGLFEVVMDYRNRLGINRIGLCFPSDEDVNNSDSDIISLFSFPEDLRRPEVERPELIHNFQEIIRQFKPDLIHVFGTEYYHSTAVVKAVEQKCPVLVSMAGVMSECTEHYLCGIDDSIAKKHTLRDFLRHDSMMEQKEKFRLRSLFERETLQNASYVAGRTKFDKQSTEKINHNLIYFHLDEVLRKEFYQLPENEKWKPESCNKYSIFISQGNYPLKGAHQVLEALAVVRKTYPEVTLRIAGDDITRNHSFREKIRISGYGRLLLKQIRKFHLEEAVSFTGMLSAEAMRKEYQNANVFVCASSVENSPNSIAEAMMMHTPVVTSEVGGITSVIEKDNECLMFRNGDIQQMALLIMNIFQNTAKAVERTEKAYQHAMISHDRERIAEQLKEIYNTCIGDKISAR